MLKRSVAAGLAAVVLLIASSCGDSTEMSPDLKESTIDDQHGSALSAEGVRTLERMHSVVNYLPFESPDELVAHRSDVFTGTVDAVLPGRSIISISPGNRTRESSALIRIKVARQIKSQPGVSTNGTVYVAIPRGSNAVGADGEVLGSDLNPSLEDLRMILPVGLRVVVASQPKDMDLDNPAVERVDEPNQVPRGVKVLEGMHPQVLTFDQGDHELMAWPGYRFDQFLAAVTQ